jgi:hypothetical protein
VNRQIDGFHFGRSVLLGIHSNSETDRGVNVRHE